MEKITDIIDEKAFAQLERLLKDLGIAQSEFVTLAGNVQTLNTELGKVKGFKDFETAVGKVTDAQEKMAQSQEKVVKSTEKAVKAEKELVKASKVNASTMAGAKNVLDEYSGTLEENIRQQLAVKLALSENSAQIKQLNKDYKDGKVGSDQYAAELEELNRVQVEGKKALTDYNLEVRRALKENTAAAGSYDEMSATLDRLRGLYRRLTEEERANSEVGGLLLTQIKEYDSTLKDLDKSMGVTNRNVGNYKEAVTEALGETGLFADQMAYLQKAQALFAAGAKVSTIATQSFSKALIASGIGIIILLLGAVITYLTKFQSGMDKVGIVMAKVGAVIDVLTGRLGKLGETVIKQVAPALKGLGLLLVGLASRNYVLIQQGFKLIGEAATNMREAVDEASDGLGDAFDNAISAAAKLKQAEYDLERATISFTKEQARLNKELEYYNSIADDATLSFKAQKDASLAALDIQQKLANATLGLAKQEEALAAGRLADAKKNGLENRALEQQYADAMAKRIESETAFTKAIYDNGKQRRQIKQDELERDLDILIDGFDNQKTVNERLIANQRMTVGQREEILRKTRQLSDSSFDEQIKTIQEFTGVVVDGNALVAESDAKALNEKIRALGLSEIIEGRLLEIVRERRLAESDLAQVEEDLRKERVEKERTSQEAYVAAKTETIRRGSELVLEVMMFEEQESLKILASQYANGELAAGEYADARLKIQRDTTKKMIDQEIKALEDMISFNKAKGIDTFEQERQLAALRLKLSQETTDKLIEDAERQLEADLQVAEARKQLMQEVGELAATLINARFEKETQHIEFQQKALEDQKNKELERVEESVDSEENKALKIAQIEKRAQVQTEALEQRKRSIAREQAVFEKASRVASATMIAILGSISALAPPPIGLGPVLGVPLAATIAAIGAVQVSQILATPLPAFATGTDSSPEGPAVVGERGSELRIDPDGRVSMTPAKASLTYLKKGTQIIPADETRKIMALSGMASIGNYDRSGGFDTDKLAKVYQEGVITLKKEMGKKRQSTTLITKGGMKHIYESGNSRQEYLNRNL